MHSLKMRSEVLLPKISSNEWPKEPINPNQRVLDDISKPMSDIYGEEERVRSPSRSSAGTPKGDHMNNGPERPSRDDDRSLDWRSDKSPLPSRNGIQFYARESVSTPLNDDWSGWDHDSELSGLRDSRQSSLDGRFRDLTNVPSTLSQNAHGGRSCISYGMKRKSVSESYAKIH